MDSLLCSEGSTQFTTDLDKSSKEQLAIVDISFLPVTD